MKNQNPKTKNDNSKSESDKPKTTDLISLRTVRRKQRELDTNIADLINTFIEETDGVPVSYVNLNYRRVGQLGRQYISVSIKTKINGLG